MGKQTRVVLKNYFNTGDVPTEAQYADVMDSQLNLSENNEGNVDLTGNITASGDISSSETGLFKKIGIGRRPGLSTAENYGQDVTLHISSSKPRVFVEATEGAPEMEGLGRAIGGLVQQHLQTEMRPGGLLNQQGSKGRAG